MDQNKFKHLLKEGHDWPCDYDFRFIVPENSLEDFEQLFAEVELDRRPSRNGKYVRFGFTLSLNSENEVIEYYQRASVVEGLISL